MVREYSRRIQIHLFCFFVYFFTSLNIHAQPRSEFVNSLWIAQEHNVLKISSVTGKSLLQIPLVEDIQAIAVDKPRGLVWLVDKNKLLSYDFNGQIQQQFPLPSTKEHDHLNLIIDEADGSLWLSSKKTLWHLSTKGQTLLAIKTEKKIEAFTLVPVNQHLWVASHKKIQIYHQSSGLLILQIPINSKIKTLAYDTSLKEIWLSAKKDLFRFSPDGTKTFQQDFKKIELIEPDGKGNQWLATEEDLFYLDISGAVIFQLNPFDGEDDEIETLRVDPANQSVWAANEHGLVQVDTQGIIQQRIQLNSEIEDIALYSDIIAPLLNFTLPVQASYLNTATPKLTLRYNDNGIGTDTNSLAIQQDGLNLAITCQHNETLSTCLPNTSFDEGLISLSATVKDYAGNLSTETLTSFTVDTIAPVITINSHWNGAFVNQSAQALTGSLSEFATLDINGLPITLGLNHIFTYPVLLLEGQNNFLFTAKDQATNVGSFPFILFLDSEPPTVANVGIIVVTDVINNQTTITGQVGSVEGDAIVEVTNLSTNVITTVQANTDGSFSLTVQASPNDKLNIVVIDKAGNRSAMSEVIVPLPLEINIVYPAEGAVLTHDSVNFEGTFKGSMSSGITINGQAAEVSPDGEFVLNDFVLNIGINNIKVVLTTLNGDSVTKELIINSEGQITPLKFEPSFNSGPAPFNVDLEFAWYSKEIIQKIDVDYEGDGVIDYTTNIEQENFTTTFAQPGIYHPSITVTTDTGIYQKKNIILVQSRESMVQLFIEIWDGMNKALVMGDIPTALTYLDDFGQHQYGPVFEVLKNKMPQIVQSYSQPQGVLISGKVGELAINRDYQGQNRIYFIYFMRNQNGLWKLHNM